MRIYIAGPMTGIKDYNFPAFNAAAERLRSEGYEVINPAELDGDDTSQPWATYLRRDLKLLVDCDAIYLLKDWHLAKGARLEQHVALELGLGTFFDDNEGD